MTLPGYVLGMEDALNADLRELLKNPRVDTIQKTKILAARSQM